MADLRRRLTVGARAKEGNKTKRKKKPKTKINAGPSGVRVLPLPLAMAAILSICAFCCKTPTRARYSAALATISAASSLPAVLAACSSSKMAFW